MKAKLIKKKEGWYNLYNGEIGIGSTHEELQLQGYKLSLKNCQAIEQDSPFQKYVLEVNGEGWDDHLYRGSRKQTEWDVEVEMEVVPDFYSRSDKDGSIFTSNKKEIPKLDSTGCLILKRID